MSKQKLFSVLCLFLGVFLITSVSPAYQGEDVSHAMEIHLSQMVIDYQIPLTTKKVLSREQMIKLTGDEANNPKKFALWAYRVLKDVEEDLKYWQNQSGDSWESIYFYFLKEVYDHLDSANQFWLLDFCFKMSNMIDAFHGREVDPNSLNYVGFLIAPLQENVGDSQKYIVLPMVRKMGAFSISYMNELSGNGILVAGIATQPKEIKIPQKGYESVKTCVEMFAHDALHVIETLNAELDPVFLKAFFSKLNLRDVPFYRAVVFATWHEAFPLLTVIEQLFGNVDAADQYREQNLQFVCDSIGDFMNQESMQDLSNEMIFKMLQEISSELLMSKNMAF